MPLHDQGCSSDRESTDGIASNDTNVTGLCAEIDATRHALTGAAVTEIALLHAQLSAPLACPPRRGTARHGRDKDADAASRSALDDARDLHPGVCAELGDDVADVGLHGLAVRTPLDALAVDDPAGDLELAA